MSMNQLYRDGAAWTPLPAMPITMCYRHARWSVRIFGDGRHSNSTETVRREAHVVTSKRMRGTHVA